MEEFGVATGGGIWVAAGAERAEAEKMLQEPSVLFPEITMVAQTT